MCPLTAVLLLQAVWTLNAERHSLIYIYTAFSQPVNMPGIHDFSAMGVLDGRVIDYYDSSTREKVPKETWMADRNEEDYWVKGTRSRKTKEEWFKVNLDILASRIHRNNTANHVLQWQHGCTKDSQPGKAEPTVTGIDKYSYDGDDFLSFDSTHKNWVAAMAEARSTKYKWDAIHQLNDYTDGYLRNDCVMWLDTFIKYREEALIKAIPPDVYLYAKPVGNNILLSCLATGFYPKDITLDIKRNGQAIDKMDGLETSGVRPNGDRTFQLKKWVEILVSDKADYSCEVIHEATKVHVTKTWDHSVYQSDTPPVIGVIIGVLVLLVFVLGVIGLLIFKRYQTEKSSSSSSSSLSTDGLPAETGQRSDQQHSEEENALISESSTISSNSSLANDGSTAKPGNEGSFNDGHPMVV